MYMENPQLKEKLLSQKLIESPPKYKFCDDDSFPFIDHLSLTLFQGFWCRAKEINSVIAFQNLFQADDTDIIVASFPKSGTTWLKSLVFSIVNRNVYKLAESLLLTKNPHQLVSSPEQQIYANITQSPDLDDYPKPRIFSSHVPHDALAASSIKYSECKIVYICRNPMDQFISIYKFWATRCSRKNVTLSMEDFFGKYCEGISWFGAFWDHILGYYRASQSTPKKVLFLKYEDLKKDINTHTKLIADLKEQVSQFLGFAFSEEEEKEGLVEQVSQFCSFDNLKELDINKNGEFPQFGLHVKDFFRKGEVGDWSNYLSPWMEETIQKVMQEKLGDSGLQFRIT